jgi:acyl carrier protein
MNEQILAMLNELRPEFDFTDSEDYVMDGLLDSFDIISLVSMAEEKYGAKVDGLDIVPENFSSIDSIVALVKRSGGMCHADGIQK